MKKNKNKIKAYSYVHMLGSDNLFIFVICPRCIVWRLEFW